MREVPFRIYSERRGEEIRTVISFILYPVSYSKSIIKTLKSSRSSVFLKTEDFKKWNIHSGRKCRYKEMKTRNSRCKLVKRSGECSFWSQIKLVVRHFYAVFWYALSTRIPFHPQRGSPENILPLKRGSISNLTYFIDVLSLMNAYSVYFIIKEIEV